MPDYLVEAGMLNLWYAGPDGPHPIVAETAAQRRAEFPNAHFLMSCVSYGEVVYGHALNPAGDGQSRREFEQFLRDLPLPIEITHHVANVYGHLRARICDAFPPEKGWATNKKRRAEQLYDPLTAQPLGIDENDLWIVSQAIEHNYVLVSDDRMTKIKAVAESEFGKQFRYENWKEPPP